MGEKQEAEQRSPNTGKRPSPTSVKELLDIVHLQQATVPLNVAVKQDADVLSSRGGFNPLPAIGKSASCSYPHVRNASPPLQHASAEEEFTRSRANSDGYQYSGTPTGRHSGPSASIDNGSIMPMIHSPRDGAHHPVPSTVGSRPTQQRRERILPPLSELKPGAERPPSRQKKSEATHKTLLRRTASGDSKDYVPSVKSTPGSEERLQRPKSSHGRRRPLPSEIIAIHNSVPAPYENEDVFALQETGQSRTGAHRAQELTLGPRDPSRPQNPAPSSSRPRLEMERPKSSKGRTRPRIRTTGSLSQGDEWSSEEDVRPRAPSPPSPGLDSDLDSGNEEYSVNNGRSVRPR